MSHHPFIARVGLAFALALLPPFACAQGSRLSFDDALRMAVEQAPAPRAQEAAALAARERAVAAAQLPDPVLRVGVANLPIDGADRLSLTRDFMTMRNIGVAREFTREDKRRARAASLDAEAAMALAQRDERRAAVRQATALAWIERHDLERALRLITQQREQAALAIDAAEAAYRGARGSASEALTARAEAAALDDRLAATRTRIAQAQATLERYVGAEAAGRALGERPDITRLVNRSGDHDIDAIPALATMTRDVTRAEAEVAAARSERATDWSAEVMLSQRGPQYSNMVSLTLSVPLASARADRQDREVAARLALLERARAERDDARRDHALHRRTLEREWSSALERGALHERQLIALAEQRAQATLAAYRAGSGSLAALLEARRAELGARIERLNLDTEAARAWVQLIHTFSAEGGQP